MAARSPPSKACQGLLLKLKKGQDVLRRGIENLKPPVETVMATQNMLEQRRLDRHCRDSLTVRLDRASDFPKKRARVVHLATNNEVGRVCCCVVAMCTSEACLIIVSHL